MYLMILSTLTLIILLVIRYTKFYSKRRLAKALEFDDALARLNLRGNYGHAERAAMESQKEIDQLLRRPRAPKAFDVALRVAGAIAFLSLVFIYLGINLI